MFHLRNSSSLPHTFDIKFHTKNESHTNTRHHCQQKEGMKKHNKNTQQKNCQQKKHKKNTKKTQKKTQNTKKTQKTHRKNKKKTHNKKTVNKNTRHYSAITITISYHDVKNCINCGCKKLTIKLFI